MFISKFFTMIRRFHLTLTALIIFVCVFPVLASAATPSGLVVCGNSPTAATECGFVELITEVQVVLDFLIFKIAAPLAALMFAYAGFLYVTNAGNESQIKQAHEIFWNVFIGLVIALAAWLVVSSILTFFLGPLSKFNFLA